jgi:predicted dehydrogenase
MVGQVLRFFPAYAALALDVKSGKYGQARTALFRRRCAAPFWNLWLGDPGKSGGGVFDLLIHDIDYSISLFGVPESVVATGHEDLQGGIDTINATLFYPGGPTVVITGGWHHKKAYPFSMEYTVVCDGGTFEFNSANDKGVTLFSAEGKAEQVGVPDLDAFTAELKYFVECCEGNTRPQVCPPEQSAASVKLTRLILEARKANGAKLPCAI